MIDEKKIAKFVRDEIEQHDRKVARTLRDAVKSLKKIHGGIDELTCDTGRIIRDINAVTKDLERILKEL